MIDLKGKPFYLEEEDICWVEQTIREMTLDEKIGQLFFPICYSSDPDFLKNVMLGHHIGGIMYRPGKGSEQQQNHRWLQEHSPIPLLIGANLENGGNGIAVDGTFVASQMEAAATGSAEAAYHLGKIAASEGMACGCNWGFAPVVDIDRNWRNPITNVRTYGSNPDFILECALAYKRGADEEGLVTAAKHFPGDGCDEVDQHIALSVNSLSCEEWDNTYGKIYRGLIEDGIKTVMAGHIAQPAYQEKYRGRYSGEKTLVSDEKKQLVPATLSPELLKGLLREKLGFNGLVITDSTCMVGFASAMKRAKALPYCIESGCDMILFNKDLDEDFSFMKAGYQKGYLSGERLHEALTRILALKASLGLHKKNKQDIVPPAECLEILSDPQSQEEAKRCADKGITLVKDTQDLLPLRPEKTKRVLLEVMGDFPSNGRVAERMAENLTKEGFAVEIYEKEKAGKHDFSVAAFREKYDLVLYLGNVENASNKVTNRLNWHTFFGNGNNCPWFVKEKPVLFVSLGNPYHLVDIPMIQTYVNCYANENVILDMLTEKLLGRSSFTGKSPTDPFCGKEYLKY